MRLDSILPNEPGRANRARYRHLVAYHQRDGEHAREALRIVGEFCSLRSTSPVRTACVFAVILARRTKHRAAPGRCRAGLWAVGAALSLLARTENH
jgi:hypothetical protein